MNDQSNEEPSGSTPPPQVPVSEEAREEQPEAPAEESRRERRKRIRALRDEEKAQRKAERAERKRIKAEQRAAAKAGEKGSSSEPSAPEEETAEEVEEVEEVESQAAIAEGRIAVAEQREDAAVAAARIEDVNLEADRRVRELEQIRETAESRAPEDAVAPSAGERATTEVAASGPDQLELQLRAADEQIDRRRKRDAELAGELQRAEERIADTKERTERALEEARQRLEQIEAQAAEAEERASQAERIAGLREQEAERERRLHEMLARINEAERRAREAESRAREAVVEVSQPVDSGSPPAPPPLETDAEPAAPTAAAADAVESTPEDGPGFAEAAETAPDGGPIDINTASFEELRNAGLSVTQTGRVLAHRERSGGFKSIDELADVPGFPAELIERVRSSFSG